MFCYLASAADSYGFHITLSNKTDSIFKIFLVFRPSLACYTVGFIWLYLYVRRRKLCLLNFRQSRFVFRLAEFGWFFVLFCFVLYCSVFFQTYNSLLLILFIKVCANSPYSYLRPFSFTSSAGSSASYCGFPNGNSYLRFVVSSVAIVHVIILYIKTPISLLARPALAIYGFLFFTACVMDSFAIQTGQNVCDSAFLNTSLYTDIQDKGLSLSCDLR